MKSNIINKMAYLVSSAIIADVFIKKHDITDEGTQFCIRHTFEGYHAITKDIDRDGIQFAIYTNALKKYCDSVIASKQ